MLPTRIPGGKREPDLTLRDGQAERDRLGDAVDDEPSAAWLSSLRFG
jgi:hypothetical protein